MSEGFIPDAALEETRREWAKHGLDADQEMLIEDALPALELGQTLHLEHDDDRRGTHWLITEGSNTNQKETT